MSTTKESTKSRGNLVADPIAGLTTGVANIPDAMASAVLAMDERTLTTFEQVVQPGGTLVINASLTERKSARKDIRVIYVPSSEIANELGNFQLCGMVALGGMQAGRAWRGQGGVGAVQHRRGAAHRAEAARPGAVRLAQGAGGFAGPDQIGGVHIVHAFQAPSLGPMQVVAIGVPWHMHAAPALARHPGAGAEDEFAGTARQHDALRCHAMKSGQRGAQRGVGRIGVAGGVGHLHGSQCLRTRPGRMAVGGKVEPCRAQGIAAAMHPHGTDCTHCRPLFAIKNIADSTMNTWARTTFDAKAMAWRVSWAVAARPAAWST